MRFQQWRQFTLDLGKVALQTSVIIAPLGLYQPLIGRYCAFDGVEELNETNAQIIPLLQRQRIIHWYIAQ